MAFINVFIANRCEISVDNDQLVIQGERNATFPIEDINSLLIENHQIKLSAYTIYRLINSGTAMFICDKYHMPSGVMYPFANATRKLKLINAQINTPKPLIKQLWKSIIKSKIINQSDCLRLCSVNGAENIYSLSNTVLSGDTSNIEAVAALKYFKYLFGKTFNRQQENIINASLNYGYSIIRGIIARTLAVYGFEISLGLFHSNELNNFNLADDIIEPYRAIVDMYVYKNIDFTEERLTTDIKRALYNLINSDVNINEQIHSLNYSIELLIQSLKQSLLNEENSLIIPKLLGYSIHSYE